MKKSVLLLCALMCTVLVRAQGLGDYMEIDGVPGFVFYLDESGEHGLVMSFPMMSQKKANKYVKKGLMTSEKAQRLCMSDKTKKIKVKSKDMAAYRKDLSALLGDEGKRNRTIIEDYCKEKNLDLAIFKGQDFAANLGDGWYIPGDKELTLFANFYSGGLGKDNYITNGKLNSRPKEVSNDPLVQNELFLITFYGLTSSTLKKWGFRAMLHMDDAGKIKMSLKIKHWLEIFDTINNKSVETASGALTCAVHEF